MPQTYVPVHTAVLITVQQFADVLNLDSRDVLLFIPFLVFVTVRLLFKPGKYT
jgi:hypothetical protein